jgi:hypothetical protein
VEWGSSRVKGDEKKVVERKKRSKKTSEKL